MGQCVKSYNDGFAANDEFQSANNGLAHGELVRDLLEQRLQMPAIPVSGLIRPELDQQILAAMSPGHLLFLEAPSGYGKTHALVSVLKSAPEASIRWVTLNGGDNAPSRFLSLLATALGLADVSAPNGGTFQDHLSVLLVTKARKKESNRDVLVLDNLHHLTNPAVVGLLHQLATNIPGNLAVVMASRLPLPFESHTLDLQGVYQHLSVDRLEFSRSETFEFFQQARDERLITSVAIDHLYNLTEGWPTPLALYLRELARGDERKPVHETESVERFIKSTVLAPLAQSQVRSLRVMAELESCSDELFLTLEGTTAEPDMPPSSAAERGLPLKPVPGRGRWYRLNPLLQAWLQRSEEHTSELQS